MGIPDSHTDPITWINEYHYDTCVAIRKSIPSGIIIVLTQSHNYISLVTSLLA